MSKPLGSALPPPRPVCFVGVPFLDSVLKDTKPWVSLMDLALPSPSVTWTQALTHSASRSASGAGRLEAACGAVPEPTAPPLAPAPAASATSPAWPCSSGPRPSQQPALSGPLGLWPSGSNRGGC